MIRRMLGLILLSKFEVGDEGGERKSNGESRGGGEIEGSDFPISPVFGWFFMGFLFWDFEGKCGEMEERLKVFWEFGGSSQLGF